MLEAVHMHSGWEGKQRGRAGLGEGLGLKLGVEKQSQGIEPGLHTGQIGLH